MITRIVIALILSLWLPAPTAAAAGATPYGLAPPYPIAPTIHTDRACYRARQPVQLTGTGFAPSAPYTASINGVNWAPSHLPSTDANGDFTTHGVPGVAFGPTQVQVKLTVVVTDGISVAKTSLMVTRPPGALLETGPRTTIASRVPLLVWGFAINAPSTRVFVHYLTPAGRPRATAALGRTTGACGYLRASLRRLFPFRVRQGRWTLQVDTSRRFVRRPVGPAHRFFVIVH